MPVTFADPSSIIVCSLNRLNEVLEISRARHVMSLLSDQDMLEPPIGISAGGHLRLSFNDIVQEMPGLVAPKAEHVKEIMTFASGWDRTAPLVIHCWAGISRSSAAAFITACALNPDADEKAIAQVLRRSSTTSYPNILMVAHADDLLGRNGRMIDAIEDIGRGDIVPEGRPFAMPATF